MERQKYGLISATKNYVKLTAKYGITANAIFSGLIMTDIIRNNGDSIPWGASWRTKRDISKVIAFIASDGSCYMTGCTSDVNGGMYINI
ncbi:SDR family oxidoreductase [Anaerospora hongkongensis]|uniref:SDR family oxidoreductase n=1 Tax=Anaerospora hongkongensis TaxID=244830 RepID=UPI0035E3D414